jgi:hypothetical protein
MVFLEDVPHSDFDVVELARRLDYEMAVKGVPFGCDVEGVVKVGFILGKVVVINSDGVAVGEGDVGFVELHLASRREIKWGAFRALAETSRRSTVG